MTDLYGQPFFSEVMEGSRRSASRVVPILLEHVQPTSVLDVGCGAGFWLEEFRSRGIHDVLGIDGYSESANSLIIDPNLFQSVDLERGFRLGRRFDLAISLEVAEHLAPEHADQFVESMCLHSEVILFSAAVPGQGGTGHVNEQWPSYWASKFRNQGFEVFDLIRPSIWADDLTEPWYRQNILIYAHPATATALGLISEPVAMLDLVHPKLSAMANEKIAALEARALAAELEAQVLHEQVNDCLVQLGSARAEIQAYRRRMVVRLADHSRLGPAWRSARSRLPRL